MSPARSALTTKTTAGVDVTGCPSLVEDCRRGRPVHCRSDTCSLYERTELEPDPLLVLRACIACVIPSYWQRTVTSSDTFSSYNVDSTDRIYLSELLIHPRCRLTLTKWFLPYCLQCNQQFELEVLVGLIPYQLYSPVPSFIFVRRHSVRHSNCLYTTKNSNNRHRSIYRLYLPLYRMHTYSPVKLHVQSQVMSIGHKHDYVYNGHLIQHNVSWTVYHSVQFNSLMNLFSREPLLVSCCC